LPLGLVARLICTHSIGVWQQHREFLAAQSGEHVRRSQPRLHSLCKSLQHQVAAMMAMQIIDPLE
jgi:hypothetical protein